MSNATGNEKIRSYALRLVGHAYAGLQERLSVSADDFSIPTRVFTLFVFEYMSHNPVAAAIHVQGLQNLLLERKERGQVLDHLLISAAEWNDNVRSLRFLMPPILNAEVLLAPKLLEDAEGVARLLEEHGLLESEPADLFAETGIPPRVEYLYKRFMYLLRIGRSLVMPDAQPFLTHRTTNSWAYATAILASKLNGIFHDARNNLANGQGDSQLLHREMATALSGVYWAFAVSNFEFLDPSTTEYWRYGYHTLSVSMTVLTALSGEINSIDWRSSTENPASLKLWLLYIATLPEQALANHSGNSTTVGHRSKHNLEFVAQARNMGIWEWKAVQEEVGRYLYFANIGPASRPWFDKAMEEY